MITPLLKTTLEPITRRRRLLRKLRWWTVVFLCLATLAAALRWMNIGVIPAQLIVLASLVMIWVGHRRAERWHPDYRALARQIEERHPELHALLLTAVEQRPDAATGKLHFLQQRVLAEAVAMAEKQQWVDAVPRSTLTVYGALAVATYVLMMICAFSLGQRQRRDAEQLNLSKKEGVEVTPGDVSLERGSGLVVLATFHHGVPSEATMVVETANQASQRIPLLKNLDDPVFGGGLPEIDADLTYRVEYAGSSTRNYVVHVFEHPRLERADATVRFPDYTKLPEKQIPDTRRVSAVEGSKLDLVFKLNKPVKSALLVAKDGTQIALRAESGKAVAELRDFPLRASQGYELRLTDTDGRTNKVPAQLTIEVLPNRRPELKFAAPRGDQRLSPIEEVAFRAEAWDDFGLTRYGLTLNVAGRGEQQIVLGSSSTVDERREVSHLLKLEELGVKPDELVSWFLWAEDVGPDGKPRRTASDMFFGEVRPFEEIFRPGDGQEGGQSAGGAGGRGGQATKLAELQKQIISATWNLKRAEESAEKSPTEKYLKDEPVVRDSQGDALKKATELGEKVEEPKSRALVENVTREMQSALDSLIAAEKSIASLPDAVAAEQSAYNALLKLAAHEFRVTRAQRGQAGQGAQGNQQQLDQLELKDERQRYETKREAEPMQNEQQREELAILNRLKELAQRQQDINERLKEMQTALREAKTEKEKEEVRRQLKRLRDEEQQLLADIDEARQKMEESPRQSQLADERRKLDETRADAQKAAESMEQNAASPALASGTRAAQKLQEMRDDLRKRTSRQFNDEMRQMRTDARELAAQQQEIGETLKGEPPRSSRRTLDGSSDKEQVANKLEKQQAALGQLTEEMKRVSEQAEAAEPLLSKELYDALRKTTQAGTDKKLEMTQQFAQRGYNSQAQKLEEKARQEIDDLKTGVEHAAESVLGNEAEALRQARAELDALTAQLNREIARTRPDLANTSGEEKSDQRADSPTSDTQKIPPGGRAASNAQQQDQRAEDQQKRGDRVGEEGQASQPNGQQTAQQAGEGEGQRRASAQRKEGGEKPGSESQQAPGQQAGEGQQPNGQGQQQTAQAGSQPGSRAQGASGQGGQRSAASSQSGESPQQARGSGGGTRGGEGSANQNSPGNQTGGRLAQLGDGSRERGGVRSGGNERGGGSGGGGDTAQAAPLTGEDFVGWSDRLRNVEEMIDDPAMRSEVARIRELAKGVRVEFKRHSVQPNWEMVHTTIHAPLLELRNRLTEELARRESKENLVPIDRDPVPTKYAERVRRYYEDLGRSR